MQNETYERIWHCECIIIICYNSKSFLLFIGKLDFLLRTWQEDWIKKNRNEEVKIGITIINSIRLSSSPRVKVTFCCRVVAFFFSSLGWGSFALRKGFSCRFPRHWLPNTTEVSRGNKSYWSKFVSHEFPDCW